MQEYPLVVCEGFFFFFYSFEAAVGLDACYFFPQCVQTVIPLIGGVLVQGLHLLPGRWRQSARPVVSAWLLGP